MILVIGDIHVQMNNVIQTNILHEDVISIIKYGVTKKISDKMIMDGNIDQFFSTMAKPTMVIFLGDLLHRHEKIDLYPFTRVEKLLMDIHLTGVELFVLVGNHDRPHNKVYMTDEHPFNAFKLWPKTHIIDRCESFERNGVKIGCVPYVPNGMFLQALDDCQIDIMSQDIIFGHSEFSGCKINKVSGTKCDKWPDNYPFVISGHIHDYEQVQHNLLYVGTPYQTTFSERPDKGIHMIAFDDDKNISIEKIILNIPPKIFLTINYSELYSVVIPEGEVKVKIIGPSLEVKKLLQSPDLVEKFKDVKVVFTDTATIKEIPQTKSNISFAERLIKELEREPELLATYQNIFSV